MRCTPAKILHCGSDQGNRPENLGFSRLPSQTETERRVGFQRRKAYGLENMRRLTAGSTTGGSLGNSQISKKIKKGLADDAGECQTGNAADTGGFGCVESC